MRQPSTPFKRTAIWRGVFALLLLLAAGAAPAQQVIFDGFDFLLDRGSADTNGRNNGFATRQGHNNFIDPPGRTGYAVRRWVFPLSRDILGATLPDGSPPFGSTVDNINPADPRQPRTLPQFFDNARTVPFNGQMGISGAWVLPVPANRAPSGGYSVGTNGNFDYNFDYYYTAAIQAEFLVQRNGTSTTPATEGELAALPNAAPNVYRAVHQTLLNTAQPIARWASGTLQPGRYAVELYMPGNGTKDNTGTVHPNIARSFVRVSWVNTINGGAFNTAGINNPVSSRIFLINPQAGGWLRLQGGGVGPASFPTDGAVGNQIVVTLYTLTPDNVADTNTYPTAPLIPADAVRFVPQSQAGNPALRLVPGDPNTDIAASGRILGPGVSTNKFTALADDIYTYIAREESVPETSLASPPLRTFVDPTDATSPQSADPTAMTTAPVFYCLNNLNNNNNGTIIQSRDKVVWRYVGQNDGGTGTASASPLLANVRLRDGSIQPIVYFVTTNADNSLGRIYALNPRQLVAATRSTNAYWIYPSVRPLTAAEVAAGNVPDTYHDPNYKGFVPINGYPTPTAADTEVVAGSGTFYYDGDLIPDPLNANRTIVRSNTRLPALGGITASPVLVDDPGGSGQLLVLGSTNGRMYAFDAGGRGDYRDLDLVPGTTQRIWSWPTFGIDAWRHLSIAQQASILPENVENAANKVSFPTSISRNGDSGPLLAGAADGHVYALTFGRDSLPASGAIFNNRPNFDERRAWQYPAANKTLGQAPSTIAIFRKTGGTSLDDRAFFTCAGRTYALEIGKIPSVTTGVAVALAGWLYPYTDPDAVPNPIAGDDTTTPLDPGFNGTAPVLIRAQDNGTTADICYVLQSNGTINALNAYPNVAPRPQLITTGGTDTLALTSCSPTAATMFGQPAVYPTGVNQIPTLVFGDTDGAIHAIGLTPVTDMFGTFLPLAWEYFDGNGSRSAAAVLAATAGNGGVIVEGDEGGQVRAYGVGIGAGGVGDTLDDFERNLGNRRGGTGAGRVSIDIRSLDIYSPVDWKQMAIPNATRTPAITQTQAGDPLGGGNHANPLAGNIGADNVYAVEWGDSLYLVAWGVYFAQDTVDQTVPVYGTAPPQITVKFTLTGRGVSVPAGTVQYGTSLLDGTLEWPDDPGLPAGADRNALAIFGIHWLDQQPGNEATGLTPKQHTVGEAAPVRVRPWVAKAVIPIEPGNGRLYTPGLNNYTVQASAEISQSISIDGTVTDARASASTLFLGQKDGLGLSQSATPVPTTTRNRTVPRRQLTIAHPIAVTVRGVPFPNMLGQANVIGMQNILANIPGIGEVLDNGNRVRPPGSTLATIKPLLAPIGSIPDGSSGTYAAVDGAGNPTRALYVVDRSNMRLNLGLPVKVRVQSRPLVWHGDWTSVMNPLPWELMPNDAEATSDYPNISIDNIAVTGNGQNAVDSAVSLLSPIYNGGGRTLTPTPFDLQVRVPKYQPANINWGAWNWPSAPNGTFGSAYRDTGGNLRGDSSGLDITGPIVGPLRIADGLNVPSNNRLAYPAAGYVSEMLFITEIPNTPSQRRGPTNDFVEPYRSVEMGISVPPTVRMRIAEQTLDIGKAPHGTGYSELTGSGFRAPFAPTGSLPWLTNPSPWDGFFLPFTLYNESNLNLFDVRIAKAVGPSDAKEIQLGYPRPSSQSTAFAVRMESADVNNLSSPPIFSLPFNFNVGGVGNIGIVSGLDHRKANVGPANNEYPLWPLPNPFVRGDDLTRLGLNNASQTFLPWADGVQAHPTIHKARVGDTVGTFATDPDLPYGQNQINGTTREALKPKISVAIPPGTPSGTYSAQIFAFEDNTPYQWRAWLQSVQGVAPIDLPRDHDAILNQNKITTGAGIIGGTPIDHYTDPTLTLKVTVREARLTNGVTTGTLSQIDPLNVTPIGANLLPAAMPITTAQGQNRGIGLYWTSNYADRALPTNAITQDAPFGLMYSLLPMPGSNDGSIADFRFGRAGVNNNPLSGFWWTQSAKIVGNSSPPLATLFPSVPGALPYLPGQPAPATERHASPATGRAVNPANALDPDAFLFWQGAVDKAVPAGGGQQVQQTDSRTFYTRLLNGAPSGTTFSFLNDPALTKLSPKPLYLKLASGTKLYLFWHAGNTSQTAIYYNQTATPDDATTWGRDQKLPTPGALAWQSDPYPVYRRARDRNGNLVDAIDLVYTGVLKGRQTVESLLTRYQILPDGSLQVMPLPRAEGQRLRQQGATKTYEGRDGAWYLSSNATDPTIEIYLVRKNAQGVAQTFALNKDSAGNFQQGRLDNASGLVYFDSSLGGQLVVDIRSGTVAFPNIAPLRNDEIVVSYTPQVMRLNTSRDDANVLPGAEGTFAGDASLLSRPATVSAGNNYGPIAILDRGLNPRALLNSPSVVSANGMTTDRLWVLYRKTDLSTASSRSAIFYKAMRLMARLPRPVALTNNGTKLRNVLVSGNAGPYEVDYVRGRIYFTEVDEGREVTINYDWASNNASGNSGTMRYRVAWGDEISSGVADSTSERLMPSDSNVNEGQVTAFKDPFADRLWIFWASTRSGSTDLYYQTIAPQLYPLTAGQ